MIVRKAFMNPELSGGSGERSRPIRPAPGWADYCGSGLPRTSCREDGGFLCLRPIRDPDGASCLHGLPIPPSGQSVLTTVVVRAAGPPRAPV